MIACIDCHKYKIGCANLEHIILNKQKYKRILCPFYFISKSKLSILNFYLFQWFFIRLGKVYSFTDKFIGWKIIGPILPFTGWWNKLIYLKKNDN